MKNQKELEAYYAQRASEYEAIYAKPERQEDLTQASQLLQDIFHQKKVLEIACGTGYWTPFIAQSAEYVLATDINESVLEIARTKNYPLDNVQIRQADLYQIQADPSFDALFGGFIWSHIKVEALPSFLAKVSTLVKPGGTIVFMDNCFVEGSNTPISEQDEQGNTYQQRSLENGAQYLVLKNFPTFEFLEQTLGGIAQNLQYKALKHFWICVFQTKTEPPSPSPHEHSIQNS